METQRGLLRRPTPLTGWGVSIAAPKGMRRAPRRVRLRVIFNGGFASKPPYNLHIKRPGYSGPFLFYNIIISSPFCRAYFTVYAVPPRVSRQ